MSEADRVFSRFPDFIKDYIYNHGWSELRDIQLEAARVIVNIRDYRKECRLGLTRCRRG